ncbi:MAG: RHS repeat-associated core domain-containing protein, partial [Janthinobacterium lividum]
DGATRSLRHDAFGRVVESSDHDGSRRLVRYPEARPDGLIVQLPEAVIGADGGTQRFVWDDRFNLARHVDSGGRERRFLRDARGQTLAVQDTLGMLRRFGWTDRGELVWDSSGDGGARSAFSYDALGRLSESSRPGEAPTRYVSDPAGRLIELHRPDGGVIRLTHDAEGHVTSHRSATGQVTRWLYDGLPYPTRRVNADGSGLLYRYDEDLNLVGLSNAKGEPYVLRYDLADQLVEEIGFDGRRRTYDYDAAGFLVAHGDEEDRGARYRRDGLGRLLERRHADGLTDRYAYDARGALTRADNDWGEIGFAYGPGGELIEERHNALTIRHRHDIRGRRVATALPDGRLIETAYDAQDRVLAVGFDGREVAAFRRDALGRETARRAGALTTLSEYDPQGRLVRQTGRSRGTGQPVIERSYRWDEADRLIETHDLARGMRRYQYDACERLVGVAGDAPESFVFDPAGNILGSDADGGGGAAIGDRLLIRGDRKFEYDGCGNRIREVRGAGGTVERLYRYRADNQLAEVEERNRRGRRVTSFAYDALGRRAEKRSTVWGPVAANDAPAPAATTTRTDFVWSSNVLLSEASTADDTLPADPLAVVYLHEPGSFRPLAQVRRTNAATVGAIYHYQLDHLGTPQEVTNDDGHVVWQARLTAWGAVAQTLVAELAQPICFQGQYHDVETGLFYNRFRYYAPAEGCYVQQDPIRLKGGSNLAVYVTPSLGLDPLGLCAIGSDAGGLGSITSESTAMSPGPLSDDLAGTFSGGRYSSGTLANDTVLYRAGTAGKPLGQFFTREPPNGILQTRIDQAVLPEWPNGGKSPVDTWYAVKFPAGTRFNVGEIGSQGGMYVGGTEQILIEQPWLIDGVQVVNSGPLK